MTAQYRSQANFCVFQHLSLTTSFPLSLSHSNPFKYNQTANNWHVHSQKNEWVSLRKWEKDLFCVHVSLLSQPTKKKPYDICDLNNYSNIFAIDISNYYFFSQSSHISEVQYIELVYVILTTIHWTQKPSLNLACRPFSSSTLCILSVRDHKITIFIL